MKRSTSKVDTWATVRGMIRSTIRDMRRAALRGIRRVTIRVS